MVSKSPAWTSTLKVKGGDCNNEKIVERFYPEEADVRSYVHSSLGDRLCSVLPAAVGAIADLRARIETLSSEIGSHPKYIKFAEAQRAMNALMAEVNEEIKYCITGERPSDCTHDCSTCKGCH